MSESRFLDYDAYRSPSAADVISERVRQLRVLNHTKAADDRKTLQEWAWLLLHRITILQTPIPELAPDNARVRELLVEISAVALAAVEAHDRRHA